MKHIPHVLAKIPGLASARQRPLLGVTLLLILLASLASDLVFAADNDAMTTPIIMRTEPTIATVQSALMEGYVPNFGGTSANGLITNFFYDTDLRDALQDIGEQAGATIIAAEEVQGFVSLSLSNVTLDKALELLLVGTGYMVHETSDYYLICSQKPSGPSFQIISESRLIRLNYIKPATAVKLLSPVLQEYVESDTDSNYVSISAPPEILEGIVTFLEALDQPPQQVALDVVIVVMEESKGVDLGFHGNWPTLQAGAFSNSGQHGAGATGASWPWGVQMGYTPDKEFTDSLLLSLNTLSNTEQATVTAHPQIMTQENKEAEINVTTEEYFNIVTDSLYYVRAELEKIEVGTKLKILPQIGSDGNITLNLTAEVSDVVARGEDDLPIVTRRTTRSTLLVEDGGTAVIAGLMNNRTRLTKNSVPGVNKIRGLGKAFSNKNKVEVAKQIYVLVTARLLTAKPPVSTESPVQETLSVEMKEDTPPIALVGEEFEKELAASLNKLDKGGA